MTKIFEISPRVDIRKCRSRSQHCIHCGKLVGFDKTALNMKNSADTDLSYRKNLWIHIECVDGFHSSIKKVLKENGAEIMARLI